MALYQISQLIDNLPSAILLANRGGKIIDANQASVELLKYSGKKELIDSLITDIFEEKSFGEKLTAGLFSNPDINHTVRGLRKNGDPVLLSVSVNQVTNADGLPDYFLVMENITGKSEIESGIKYEDELYRMPGEATFEAVFISENGICITQNKTAEKMFGYTPDEAMGKKCVEWVHPGHRETVEKKLFSANERPYEVRALRKDGSTFPAEIEGRTVQFHGKEIRITAIRNITKRKKIQLAKQRTEKKYKAIVENMTELIYRWKPDGTRTFVNKAYAEYYNKTVKELTGTSFVDTTSPEAWQKIKSRISKLNIRNQVCVNENKTVVNGKTIWKEWTDRAIFNKDGRIHEIQSTGRDITQRKLAEEKLIESEERYHTLFEKSSDPTLLSEDGVFIECNDATVSFLKCDSKDEIIGKNPSDFSPEFQPDGQKSADRNAEIFSETIKNGRNRFEWLRINKKGEELYVDVALTVIPIENKTRIHTVWRDITDQKKGEQRLMENQALLQATLESTGEGILVVNNKGEITHYNANFLRLWNIPQDLIATKDDRLLLKFVMSQLKYPREFIRKVEALYNSDDISFDIIDFKDGGKIERNSYPLVIGEKVEGRVWGFRDVTEKFAAEVRLRESESRFRQLIQSLPDAIFVSEIGEPDRGKILDLNPAAELQTGYTRDELLTKNMGRDLLESFNQNKFKEDEQKLVNGEIIRVTEKKRKKNGESYWVEVLITCITLGGKKVALSVNRDITELKKSEQALHESRQNLLMIYETAGVNLIHIQVEKEGLYTIRSVNNTYLLNTGRKKEDVVNKRIEEVFDEESILNAREKYAEAIKRQTSVRWEETGEYPSGRRSGAITVTPVFNDEGVCTSLIEAIHDITEKKEIESKIIKSQGQLEKLVLTRTLDLERSRKAAMNLLQDSNEQRKRTEEALKKLEKSHAEIRKLSQAVEQNPAAVLIIDTEGYIEYANPYYLEKTGFTLAEIAGKNPKSLVFANTLPSRRKDIWEKLTSGKTWRGEITNIRKNAEDFWESISISPLFDNNQNILSYIKVGQDISERKKLEQDLVLAKEKADEATRAKSEFLANMSHEIRTPMNAILGFAELLSAIVIEQNAKNYLQALQTSGKSLLNLINDILDLSKVEAGALQLNYDFIDLHSLFRDIRSMFSVELADKKLNFVIEVENNIPAGILLDEARLRQVLINLVNNAVKFTDSGQIKLKARSGQPVPVKNKKNDFTINLVIEVEDSGIGISEDFQKIIFNSFTQHERHDTKKYGGTGLGLAISQKLVKLMNGQILVTSEPGKGSCFSILLKDTLVTNASLKKKKTEHLGINNITFDPALVLVVNANESNLAFLTGILEYAGLRTITVQNGKEAVQTFRDTKPDLILTDFRVPGMNGIELLNTIKQSENEAFRSIPVICLSPDFLKSPAYKFNEFSFDGYLNTPVQIPDLLRELTGYLGFRRIPASGENLSGGVYNFYNISDENLAKIKKCMNEELIPLWRQIRDRQPVKKVRLFGTGLIEAGNNFNAVGLKDYGNDIVDSLNSFNIEGIMKLVRLFPDILKQLGL